MRFALLTWSRFFFVILIFSFLRPSFLKPETKIENFFLETELSETETFFDTQFSKIEAKTFFQDQIFLNRNRDFFGNQIFRNRNQDFFLRPNSLKPKPKPSKNWQKS